MPSFALGKELSGLKGLLGRAGYGAGVFTAPSWMFGLFNQGQSSSATSAAINRAAQIVPGLSPNPRTDLGRQLGNELQYIGGQLMQGRNPYAKPAVGNIPPSANGESYRRAELRLADAARPGGGGGGGGNAGYSVAPFSSPAAERAYQSDKAAVAQQVAQDPALSKYDRDRAAAIASGDQAKMDAVRDQGMAIWAAKYGPGSKNDLASKVKPGQSGYDIIQQTINPATAPMPPLSASSQAMLDVIAPVDATGARPNITPMPGQALLYGAQTPQQVIMTPPPGVNAPQGLPGIQSIAPADAYTQGLEVDPEMRKKFQALLNQTQAQ